MSSTNNCRNLFYSLSHVLREFNHCYGFFENTSLCNYLDEELKHCLLFYHINDDEKENMIKYIEYNLLRLNPIKYVSMALELSSTNTIEQKLSNHNNLLLTIMYFSTTITLSPLSPSATNNAPIVPIMGDGNISLLLNEVNNNNNKCYSMDTLSLHSICHCIDYEMKERDLIKTIHRYLGKTHYDPYFDRGCLSDKAVQFSTLRLHTNRQVLLNRLWSNIGYCSLSNAFFERNHLNKRLIKSLLNDFVFENEELVICRILYGLIISPVINLKMCHKYGVNVHDDQDENNEILSVDLEWVPMQSNQTESDEILSQCLMTDDDGDDGDEGDEADGDDLDCFLEYILHDKEFELELDWTLVWSYFDDPLLRHVDLNIECLLKLTKISIEYDNVEPFLQSIVAFNWCNKGAYFKIISNSLSCSSIHCNEENQIIGNQENENGWNSLDLYDVLLALSNTNLYLQIKTVLKNGLDLCPDVVIYGIISSQMECALKEEILDLILPTYLNSPNLDIKLNQFCILYHSDQYLFCKYIRFMGNSKIIEIADILNKLYGSNDIHPLRILTHFMTAHCSSLSFPILLSICLHSKKILNSNHIHWFFSNGLNICNKQLYNALMNLIITDQHIIYPNYIKLVFIHLFKYNEYIKQTQIAFLYQLLSRSHYDYDYSMLCDFPDIDKTRFSIFQTLIDPDSDPNIIHTLFNDHTLSLFEMCIILLIIYLKISHPLFVQFVKTKAIDEYLRTKWPFYHKYICAIISDDDDDDDADADDDDDDGGGDADHEQDPFPLVDIIMINAISAPNTMAAANGEKKKTKRKQRERDKQKQKQKQKHKQKQKQKHNKQKQKHKQREREKEKDQDQEKEERQKEKEKKATIDRINLLISDLNKENRLNRFSEIEHELNENENESEDCTDHGNATATATANDNDAEGENDKKCINNHGLLSWFARVLVHRSSTDFESQSVFIELLEYIASKLLFETVINLTYDAISSLLSSSTIDEQSQQRMILRGLGSWIGKLTIGRTRPLLQKKLNLRTLIVVAYEQNRLIVVIPFVSKILESTIGNSIFCPPNPWLMSILSLIAELHIYVEKLAVTYEIEQLFQHLNISAKSIEPTNIIRERIKKNNIAALAPVKAVKIEALAPPPVTVVSENRSNTMSNNGFIDFKNLKTRIPNLVQYVRVKEFADKMEKEYGVINFCDIVAHGFDRCVCEIVPVCVERSIDVACICSRELVLKDTISEVSSNAIRKCANQMVSTLSGALTLVICREPIKVSAVQQIKKCLKDAGYIRILKQYQTTMDGIIISIVDCNLDLVCNMAEKLAADRATKILEHNLGGLFSSRSPKTHPIEYNKNNIRMQRRVYEDFDTIRSMLRASCRDGFTEWNLIYQKFIFKFNKFEQQITSNQDEIDSVQQNQLSIDIADLLKNLLFTDNNNCNNKKLQTLQFIINKILSFEHIAKLQNNLFMILTMVRDGHKAFNAHFTKSWLIQNNLENIVNKKILLGLLDYNLVCIDDIDKFIASLIVKKHDEKAINVGIEIIRCFVLCRKFSLSDFKSIHDALYALKDEENVSLLLQQLDDTFNEEQQLGSDEEEEQEEQEQVIMKKTATANRPYINYQTRVIDLLRKSFSIKGPHQSKLYNDFINNEMAQFLANQQSICRFLEVSIKIVIGKCTEDLKNPCFGQDLKDVIDAFGKLVVSCIKRIDFKLMIKAFFNCIHNDIMNRIKTKPSSLFNQRPYLRLIVFVLFELSEITFIHHHQYPLILLTFAQFLNDMKPQKCPEFIFAWMQLLSHSKFMPKILSDHQIHKQSVMIFQDLLMSLLQFVDPFWRSPQSPPSVCLLFQGTLRILLVLLHDFPSFLCEYHFSFCQNIPISSFQMRNLVLSAFPKNTQLPDPFQPNLNLQSIVDMDKEPKISPNYLQYINNGTIKHCIDNYLHKEIAIALSLNLKNKSKNKSKNKCKNKMKIKRKCNGFVIQYNLCLIHAIILYLANKKPKNSKMLDFLYNLALELDAEGRYHLFNAVCNNLRYPNSHTKFCSETILFMFKKSNVVIKEQITRILLERLVVHRPHPWGLLITFIQLIKQPEYKFWDEPFTRCAPEIESLFQTVASSCFRVFN